MLRYRLRPEVRRSIAQQNLSQNAVARQCGISSGYMAQLLAGHRCVGPVVRQRLQAALAPLAFADLFEEVDT